MTNWKKGMKVVALKTANQQQVVRGRVYTVSGVSECCHTVLHIKGAGQYTKNFCSVCFKPMKYGWQGGNAKYFRPLLSNEQEALDRIEQEVNEEEPAFA